MLYIQIKQNVSIYEPYLPGEVATSSFISNFMHVCIYIRACVFSHVRIQKCELRRHRGVSAHTHMNRFFTSILANLCMSLYFSDYGKIKTN